MPSSKVFVVPSKTYLVGEYSVLKGGPSLLLATKPCFRLEAQVGDPQSLPFHPASPAGQFYLRHQDELARYQSTFHDPHQGQGGFGASSAQLLTLMALQNDNLLESKNTESSFKLLNDYLNLAAQSGAPMSGGDLMAQWAGRIALFRKEPFALETLDWPFQDLGFALFRTGFKVPTHEHVRQLKDFTIARAAHWVDLALQALKKSDSAQLAQSVHGYRLWLSEMGFEASTTSALLKQIEATNLTLAVKGCGAMGADVVLALFRLSSQPAFLAWAKQQKLSLIATSDDLTEGLLEVQL